jgi:hypothetical protein
VLVTVPVLALLGATEEPAMLDGYGPIPASMARDLVAEGAESFHRVLTDPRDGAPLEIGRTSYRIPKTMRQWLRLRDGKCPFPGCANHSLDTEADHLLAWANGGTTGISNLGQPCRKHHHLKHTSTWAPTPASKNQPPGWTTPTGRHYPSEAQDWEPPTWPKTTNRAETTNKPGTTNRAGTTGRPGTGITPEPAVKHAPPPDPDPERAMNPEAVPIPEPAPNHAPPPGTTPERVVTPETGPIPDPAPNDAPPPDPEPIWAHRPDYQAPESALPAA